ncbi:hypothetical protein ACFVRD_35065 [Streptomyces sp. NPDC057908]|uniref:hypothetical protein n=1 Tax=Streptomyces sp. NPDC057908 TaxID=3346276 RepID=UPI0036EEE8A0
MSTAADVDSLLRLMPPPEDGGTAVDWTRMAETWGRPFPLDYQRFMEVYGAGELGDFLVILEPEPKAPSPTQLEGMLVETGNAQDMWPGVYKAPDLEGTSPKLITWGVAASADVLCWDASSDDPSEWPVLVFNRGEIQIDRYDCGMAAFLTGLLRADFPKCPLSDVTLWGLGATSFVKD